MGWVVGSSNSFQDCERTYKNKNGYETGVQRQSIIQASIVRLKLHTECSGIAISNNQGVISTVATVVVALFTATLWLSAREQGRLTGASNAVAKTSADAAEKSATAALIQARGMVAAERAYMIVDPILTPLGNDGWTIYATNTGRTRAHCKRCYLESFRDLPEQKDWIVSSMIPHLLDLSVSTGFRVLIGAVYVPPDAAHVLGRLTFEDVFGQTHHEWFHYMPSLNSWIY